MRDDIFKLIAHDKCTCCYNPIDIRLHGTDASCDLFCYWVEKDKLKYNRLFYTGTYGNSSVKTCYACYVNKRNGTPKARRHRELTGKMLHPVERSLTHEEIKTLWQEFRTRVKDKLWLINAYTYLKWSGDTVMWYYYFNDIFRFFHSDVESDFVYDLEEYDQYKC